MVSEEHVSLQNSHGEIPEKVGLGLTLDLDVVEEHTVEGEMLVDEA